MEDEIVVLEYPVTEKEFADAVGFKKLGVVNPMTALRDGYQLYGKTLGDHMLFKATVPEVEGQEPNYSIRILCPLEIKCIPCGIKFNTEEHTTGCPICKESAHTVLGRNRDYEIDFTEYENLVSEQLQNLLRVVQPVVLYKYDQRSRKRAKEAHAAALEMHKKYEDKLEPFKKYFEKDAVDTQKAEKENKITAVDFTADEKEEK